MFKKYLSLILAVLIINIFLSSSAFAGTKEEKANKLDEKVKANIFKLGTGKDSRVELRLKDGTKLKGYVSQINETSFVVVDEKTGASSEVPYSRAKQVKGHNLSTGVKIAIGVGIALAVLIIIAYAVGPNVAQ